MLRAYPADSRVGTSKWGPDEQMHHHRSSPTLMCRWQRSTPSSFTFANHLAATLVAPVNPMPYVPDTSSGMCPVRKSCTSCGKNAARAASLNVCRKLWNTRPGLEILIEGKNVRLNQRGIVWLYFPRVEGFQSGNTRI